MSTRTTTPPRRHAPLKAMAASLIAAPLLLASATPAWASHHLGSGSRGPYFTTKITDGRTGHSAVYAVLVPVGSDSPRDALVAATARVSYDHCDTEQFVDPSTACPTNANTSTVRRVQVDRLELDYVEPGHHHIYTKIGPVNTGQPSTTATTTGQGSLPCSNQLAIRIYISVRYADGSLAHYGVSGPTFIRC